jgi:copper homeostasis protein (lipoprotein)
MKYLVLLVIIFFSPSFAKTSAPELPASFSGTLPCADCEGINYHLNLLPNNIFYLTTEYLGKKEGKTRFDDMGTYSTKNKIFTLKGGHEAPLFFEMRSRSTLRKLDMNAKPIDSKLNYDLKRDGQFTAVQPRLFMSGMYSTMADAGIFKNCSTGQTLSVAQEKENLELERAYLSTQGVMSQPVLALIEGEIVQHPNMEGNLSTLIVHKFLRVEPSLNCFP